MSNYLKQCRQRGCGCEHEEPVWQEDECCEKHEKPNKPPEKCDWDWERCKKPKHDKPQFPVTVLSCGNGSGLSLPVNGVTVSVAQIGNGYTPTLVVGTVSLDSRGLENPTVKVDFSSLINFRASSTTGDYSIRLIFQLSRSCNNGNKIPLGTWTYEKSLILTGSVDSPTPIFDFKDPFSFTWCECHDCVGCCTYLVELIDISTYNIECASITNVGINAQASGLPENHR